MFKGDVQSNCENDFIRKALNEEKRIDGREFMEARQVIHAFYMTYTKKIAIKTH